MKKKIEINKKLTNLLMKSGKKATSEKLIKNSVKTLQKEQKKQQKKLYQLAFKNSISIFKLHISINKKKKPHAIRETSTFISNTNTRKSLALKVIISSTNKQKLNKFSLKLKQEILQTAQNKSLSCELKTNLHKKVLLNKHLFNYYRW